MARKTKLTQEEQWKSFTDALDKLSEDLDKYHKPVGSVDVGLNITYQELNDLYTNFQETDESKLISLRQTTDGLRDVKTLYGLEKYLQPGTILLSAQGYTLRLERIGNWMGEGIGPIEEFVPFYALGGIEELKKKLGDQAEQVIYGLRAEDQGHLFFRESEETLFVPYERGFKDAPGRLWHRGELLGLPPVFVVRDESLIQRLNSIYEKVNPNSAETCLSGTVAFN